MIQDGWLDGQGLAPSPEGLDWLTNLFADQYPDSLPFPYVYPVAEGGVQLEWPFAPQDATLEISFEEMAGYWHVLDHETDEVEEKTLDFAEDSSWNWVVGRIRDIAGG